MKAGIGKVKLTEREQTMLDALIQNYNDIEKAYGLHGISEISFYNSMRHKIKHVIESVTGKSIEESIK